MTAFQVGGINEKDFNEVLDQVEQYYTPVIAAKGGNLRVNRYWTDDTVNASASQMGSTWVINMYGGLARHQVMTKDGFMLVACHEIGHHIGGAPKGEGWFGVSWATNEGGADYFATLRCLRNLFQPADSAEFVATQEIDAAVRQKCEEIYSTQDEENMCMRSAMAGRAGAMLFHVLRKQASAPQFTTPDPTIVSRMDDAHPGTQCRLDTYYQGGLCVHDRNIELSNYDANVGTCTMANGNHDGLRPLCWFKP
ncbi:MAG: hypothetical protein KF799_11445 [Bdellovibrionales bacterium]|nr:hypothetical protein [Bdellovibrionales bacterium]